MHVLLSTPPAGVTRLDALGSYVESWGALAPLVYVGAVVVEVHRRADPRHAPVRAGRRDFRRIRRRRAVAYRQRDRRGHRVLGGRHVRRRRRLVAHEGSRARPLREQFTRHGAWIIFLLRVNPLTSSDLVSYAAGLSGVRSIKWGSARRSAWRRSVLRRRTWPRRCSIGCRPGRSSRGTAVLVVVSSRWSSGSALSRSPKASEVRSSKLKFEVRPVRL